jgi:putative endonuclease
MSDAAEVGRRGEAAAESWLRNAGLRFCDRNYRSRHGEIDLIFRDGDTLVLVEVRTRTGESDPLHTVNLAKQRRIVRTAADYIRAHRLGRPRCRFDVVTVRLNPSKPPQIAHFEAAFNLDRELLQG